MVALPRLDAREPKSPLESRSLSKVIRWATWITAGSALALALLLVLSPWQQYSSGAGQVIALSPMDRTQSIDAPISGRVTRWFVAEGSRVEAGDPIVELVDIDPDYVARLQSRIDADRDRLEAADAAARAYTQQLGAYEQARQMKVRSAEMKITVGEQKLEAAQQKQKAARAELEAALKQVQRQRGLAERGLISQRALELAELSATKSQAEVDLAAAGISEAKASLTALQAERLRVDAEGMAKVQTAEAALRKANADAAYARRDLVKAESELSRQDARQVKAPRSGTILSVDGNQGGQVVSSGKRLALLVPNSGRRAAELWVSGNDAPLVQPGRKVRLQFEGWPAVQFVGWPSVAVGTFGGVVQLVDAASSQDGKLRVVVVADEAELPWPSRQHLRLGARAKAWVLLDEVTLGWELWRLVNGFPLSVPDPLPLAPSSGSAGGGKS